MTELIKALESGDVHRVKDAMPNSPWSSARAALIGYRAGKESMREKSFKARILMAEDAPAFGGYAPGTATEGEAVIFVCLPNIAGIADGDREAFDAYLKDTLVHELIHAVEEIYGHMFSESAIAHALAHPNEMATADDAEDMIQQLMRDNERLREELDALSTAQPAPNNPDSTEHPLSVNELCEHGEFCSACVPEWEEFTPSPDNPVREGDEYHPKPEAAPNWRGGWSKVTGFIGAIQGSECLIYRRRVTNQEGK